ncbi:MAG TPA: hypothetical protein VLK36_13910, partial [Gaiellaceae bacterium]|nr:hypothetical protein [Gaiellaceae bacterium]
TDFDHGFWPNGTFFTDSATQAAPPRVTFIADSVADVLLFNPGPFQTLGQGLDLQILAQPCRKLIDPGCPAENSDHPPSALATIQQVGAALGPEVVLEVGYNDFYDSYVAGLDQVMNALVAAGVQHVVWVTLVENQGTWAQINELIRAAPARWPQVTVADWAPVAAGQTSWFVDAAHMNYQGAVAFADFLHPYLIAACGTPCAPPPPPPPPTVPAPQFCGLARTVNGFDPVRVVKGVSCPRARAAVVGIEHGRPSPWVCSRAVHADYELDCRTSAAELQVLERSPVAAVRHGGVVTLANWSFRLERAALQGRTAEGRWQTLIAKAPYCVPAAPREALVALRLRPKTPNGGCFAPR